MGRFIVFVQQVGSVYGFHWWVQPVGTTGIQDMLFLSEHYLYFVKINN